MHSTSTTLLLVIAFTIHFAHTFSWRFGEGADEPLTSRDIRAKEISPPSYMKRSEREQLMRRHIWLDNLNPRMIKRHELLQPLPYSLWLQQR